jgi:hypothetical protein
MGGFMGGRLSECEKPYFLLGFRFQKHLGVNEMQASPGIETLTLSMHRVSFRSRPLQAFLLRSCCAAPDTP